MRDIWDMSHAKTNHSGNNCSKINGASRLTRSTSILDNKIKQMLDLAQVLWNQFIYNLVYTVQGYFRSIVQKAL